MIAYLYFDFRNKAYMLTQWQNKFLWNRKFCNRQRCRELFMAFRVHATMKFMYFSRFCSI